MEVARIAVADCRFRASTRDGWHTKRLLEQPLSMAGKKATPALLWLSSRRRKFDSREETCPRGETSQRLVWRDQRPIRPTPYLELGGDAPSAGDTAAPGAPPLPATRPDSTAAPADRQRICADGVAADLISEPHHSVNRGLRTGPTLAVLARRADEMPAQPWREHLSAGKATPRVQLGRRCRLHMRALDNDVIARPDIADGTYADADLGRDLKRRAPGLQHPHNGGDALGGAVQWG